MGFFIQNMVTFDNCDLHNDLFCIISLNLAVLGANYMYMSTWLKLDPFHL